MRGFTLTEMMIGLAIVAIVLFAALPAFSVFLQNTQIKNAAQSVLTGLTLARAEAVRRNSPVRFQFVSSLTSSCTLSSTKLNWVVSQDDPSSACNAAPSGTAAPRIVQKRSATEGTANVSLSTAGGTTVIFNGLGRLASTGITEIGFGNVAGTCTYKDATNGTMRCMRIVISTGGEIRMCDPKVVAPAPPDVDPRACPAGGSLP